MLAGCCCHNDGGLCIILRRMCIGSPSTDRQRKSKSDGQTRVGKLKFKKLIAAESSSGTENLERS